MKSRFAVMIAVAIVALAFQVPESAHAREAHSTNGSTSGKAATAGEHEAMNFVRARAQLKGTLDARTAKDGTTFEATLRGTVHLKDGPELPSGSVLMGVVSNDDMHEAGKAKLALRFTEAKLKDGKVIPIKATIVGVVPADSGMGGDSYGNETNDFWGRQVKVDEIGALSGVDLHSDIVSSASGVFVSTKKDDVKLKPGTLFDLAVGERGTSGTAGS